MSQHSEVNRVLYRLIHSICWQSRPKFFIQEKMYTSNNFPGNGKFCFPALNIVCVNRKIQSSALLGSHVLFFA